MIQLANSPAWFYAVDATIDLFSAAVLVLIALASIYYYRLVKEKNYLWFTLAYLILAVSFICKAAVQWLLRAVYIANTTGGLLNIAGEEFAERIDLFYGVFFINVFFLLLGFYILYSLSEKQSKSNHFLFIILFAVAAYCAGPEHVIIHSVLMLFLILLSIDYWKHFREHRRLSTRLLAISFSVLALSELLFVLVRAYSIIYVFAALMQFAAFVMLLLAFIFINHGKKTVPTRYHA